MQQRAAYLPIVCCLPMLASCQGYDFTINDKVVYSPPSLFTDFTIPDEALRTCIEQAVVDGNVTAVEQLTTLNCSHAGIQSVEGLSVFMGLVSLKLADNSIRNLVEIGQLGKLQTLYLENNDVIDPVPLYSLHKLATLDLTGNKNLQCPRAGTLQQLANLSLPGHCR
jgi:Leucine-rich repeat (LRR) protein